MPPALPLPLQRPMYKLSPWESLFSLDFLSPLFYPSVYHHLSISIYLSVHLSFYIYLYASSRPWREVGEADLSKFYLLFSYTVKNCHTTSSLTSPNHTPATCSSRFCLSFFCCHRNVVTSTSKKALGRWNLDESSAETSAPNDHMCCVLNGEALRLLQSASVWCILRCLFYMSFRVSSINFIHHHEASPTIHLDTRRIFSICKRYTFPRSCIVFPLLSAIDGW